MKWYQHDPDAFAGGEIGLVGAAPWWVYGNPAAEGTKWYRLTPYSICARRLEPGQSAYGCGQFPPHQHVRHFVYVIGREEGPTKVGLCLNLQRRIRALQTASPFAIDLFWSAWVPSREIAREMEVLCFNEFERLNGEWLAASPTAIIRFLEA